MPASDKFTPIKHRMKGKGFEVPSKCPNCEIFHTTIQARPIDPWAEKEYHLCPACKHNRSKTEQGEGYEPYGRTKRRAVNG